MVHKTVYLAGPITGLSYGEATDWRSQARDYLGRSGIKAVSPLRAKVYLRDMNNIADSYTDDEINTLAADKAALTNMSTPRGITSRDRFDCLNCSVILANLLGANERVSIGTVMEIAWADSHRIPAVVIMEKEGNPHDHAMVNECTAFRVASLEEGLEVVRAILGDY
jgi:nucleoside 2-deoxyribosyltransferase